MSKFIFFSLIISLLFSCASCAMDEDLPHEDPSKAIFEAVKSGNSGRVLELIQTDPTVVDARNISQDTPLHVAGFYNKYDIAEILLENGANVYALNNMGWTPLESSSTWWSDVDGVIDGISEIRALLEGWMIKARIVQIKKPLLTFLIASHPRCGEHSPAHLLPRELYVLICEKVLPLSREEMSEAVKQQVREEEKEREKHFANMKVVFEAEKPIRLQGLRSGCILL